MTLNQLASLTEDELDMVLYVINVMAPPDLPKMTFEPRHLTWFKHDMLVKKLLDSFKTLKPEGHSTYVSLMQKLGVKVEIKPNEPQRAENTGSNQQTPIPSGNADAPNVGGNPPSGSNA